MFDFLREALYRALATPKGDAFSAVRASKDMARRLNTALGQPLAERSELQRREAAKARLKFLRAEGSSGGSPTGQPTTPLQHAPVLVYCEVGRNTRELTRIEELLGAKGLAWKRLDVTGDEATLDFITRQAGCERNDLPVVFVADRVVGTFDALVRADVSGELERLVHAS